MQPLHLRVALTLLLICCPSFSVASIVVGVRTNDEIFIGADSKMVRDEPRKVWTECKTGFNGNVAWGYIGTISSEEDNFSLAQDVQFYMSTNGTFLDRARALESTLQIKLSNIASRWKKRSPTFYAERYEGQEIVAIIFATNEKGFMRMRHTKFVSGKEVGGRVVPNIIDDSGASIPGIRSGASGATVAVGKELNSNAKLFDAGLEKAVRHLIQVAIKDRPDVVGYPISIVTVSRSRIHWVAQPPICKK